MKILVLYFLFLILSCGSQPAMLKSDVRSTKAKSDVCSSSNPKRLTSKDLKKLSEIPQHYSKYTAVVCGDQLIIWGTKATIELSPQGGWSYDFKDQKWSELKELPMRPRDDDHVIAVYKNQLIVWGGSRIAGYYHGWSYSFENKDWTNFKRFFWIGRSMETAVIHGDQMIVWGGYQYDPVKAFGDGWSYDLNKQSELKLEAPKTLNALVRRDHSAAIYKDNMVIWGGTNLKSTLKDGWIFNLLEKKWSELPSPPLQVKKRSKHSSVIYNDKMIIWGGYSYKKADKTECSSCLGTNRQITHRDGWSYDFEGQQWSEIAKLPPKLVGRNSHGAVVYGDQMIIFGGMNKNSLYADALVYDIAKDQWLDP